MLYAIADTVTEIVSRVNFIFAMRTGMRRWLLSINDGISESGIWGLGDPFEPKSLISS